MHPLVELARKTIDSFVRHGRVIDPPQNTIPEMKEQAGVFVSIKKRGQLRGCIGTFEPTQPNVAEEIIHNAISAATRDPRFPPVNPGELSELSISVDLLTAPERVEGIDDLDPKTFGVIVERGWQRGLLLPDLEGIDTAEQQVEIACRKAGLDPDETITLYRFQVKRYK